MGGGDGNKEPCRVVRAREAGHHQGHGRGVGGRRARRPRELGGGAASAHTASKRGGQIWREEIEQGDWEEMLGSTCQPNNAKKKELKYRETAGEVAKKSNKFFSPPPKVVLGTQFLGSLVDMLLP